VKRRLAIGATLFRSALRGLQSSALTSGIAVFTIAVALVLTGGFALVASNMAGVLQRFGEDLQVVAYLEDGLDAHAMRSLVASIETVEGVDSVELVSKEAALERFRERLAGSSLLDGLEENPLPASLVISLLPESRTTEGIGILVAALSGLPGVSELAHGQKWVEGYARFASLVRAGGLVLAVVLGLAALLIVANTIRLAVYSREDELEILSLVGASRSFVRVPFLIEGLLQGAVGGSLAVALLFVVFHGVLPQLAYGLELILGDATPHFFDALGIAGVVGTGAGLGLVGSITALVGWSRSA
jgi:cell division transport system permease protein